MLLICLVIFVNNSIQQSKQRSGFFFFVVRQQVIERALSVANSFCSNTTPEILILSTDLWPGVVILIRSEGIVYNT